MSMAKKYVENPGGHYTPEFKIEVLEYYFKHGGDAIYGLKSKTASQFSTGCKSITRMLDQKDLVKIALERASKAVGRNLAEETINVVPSRSRKCRLKPEAKQKLIESGSNSSDDEQSESENSLKLGGNQTEAFESPVIVPELPDHSILRKPVESSVINVSHLTKLLASGTDEVKSVLSNECDVVLECKICRNFFRSVVNLIAHKRIYCQQQYKNVQSFYYREPTPGTSTESPMVILEQSFKPEILENNSKKSETKVDKIASKLAQNKSNVASDASHCSDASFQGSSQYYKALQSIEKNRKSLNSTSTLLLQDINGVPNVKYQTYIPPNGKNAPKYSTAEILKNRHKRKNSDTSVHLDSEGNVRESVLEGDSAASPRVALERMETLKDTLASVKKSHLGQKSQILVQKSQNTNQKSLNLDQKSENPSKKLKKMDNSRGDSSNAENEIIYDEEEIDSSIFGDEKFPCDKCSEVFPTKARLSYHVEDEHGIERTVYTCPICKAIFLTIWGGVKHLVKVHKKKKHHADRLRDVILKRAYKQVLTTKDSAKYSHKSMDQVQRTRLKVEREEISKRRALLALKEKEENKQSSLLYKNKNESLPPCVRCGISFETPSDLSAHMSHCKPSPRPSPIQGTSVITPEKKIAIQIRKEYKKEPKPISKTLSFGDQVLDKFSLKIQKMIKKLCDIGRLICKPCGQSYKSPTILKRHAAQHLGWTRFSCSHCVFKNFDKYLVVKHCWSEHKIQNADEGNGVLAEQKLGTFNYYLPQRLSDDMKVEDVKKSQNWRNQNGNLGNSDTADEGSEDSSSIKSEVESKRENELMCITLIERGIEIKRSNEVDDDETLEKARDKVKMPDESGLKDETVATNKNAVDDHDDLNEYSDEQLAFSSHAVAPSEGSENANACSEESDVEDLNLLNPETILIVDSAENTVSFDGFDKSEQIIGEVLEKSLLETFGDRTKASNDINASKILNESNSKALKNDQSVSILENTLKNLPNYTTITISENEKESPLKTEINSINSKHSFEEAKWKIVSSSVHNSKDDSNDNVQSSNIKFKKLVSTSNDSKSTNHRDTNFLKTETVSLKNEKIADFKNNKSSTRDECLNGNIDKMLKLESTHDRPQRALRRRKQKFTENEDSSSDNETLNTFSNKNGASSDSKNTKYKEKNSQASERDEKCSSDNEILSSNQSEKDSLRNKESTKPKVENFQTLKRSRKNSDDEVLSLSERNKKENLANGESAECLLEPFPTSKRSRRNSGNDILSFNLNKKDNLANNKSSETLVETSQIIKRIRKNSDNVSLSLNKNEILDNGRIDDRLAETSQNLKLNIKMARSNSTSPPNVSDKKRLRSESSVSESTKIIFVNDVLQTKTTRTKCDKVDTITLKVEESKEKAETTRPKNDENKIKSVSSPKFNHKSEIVSTRSQKISETSKSLSGQDKKLELPKELPEESKIFTEKFGEFSEVVVPNLKSQKFPEASKIFKLKTYSGPKTRNSESKINSTEKKL